jgi:ABC-type polysaccharide/polyol phosphate transport system ATPase subunit
MAGPAIVLEDVSKSFRIPSVKRTTIREHALELFRRRRFDALCVLDRLGLEVARGTTVGIMGRNGSGKSTLLRILSGIYAPDSGRVRVEGRVTPILELGLGWNPELDAVDNVMIIGTVMGLSLREAEDAIGDILEFAELTRFSRLQLKHFSTGMASRLAYSVAFHAVQDVLLVDEVLAVGDASFKAKCEVRFRQLKAEGRTIVAVTHDPLALRNLCDRALLLERGQILMDGPPVAISNAYLNLLGQPPLPTPPAPAPVVQPSG